MDQRIGVVGRLTAKPGKDDELAELFKELSALAKAHEPGMLQHAILRSDSNPASFVVVEVFRDQAAFDAHSKTPHYPEVGRRVAALIDSQLGGGVEVFRVVEASH
jgi:quinol monooxygenase YgiN